MIIWSSTASNQLIGLDQYLQERDPAAANRVILRIASAINGLEQFPEIGRLGRIDGTRELVISETPYLAMYRVRKGNVYILALMHGAQQWPQKAPRV